MTIEKLSENAEKLLSMIGDRGTCKGCGREIWWIKTKNGKSMPITEQMVSHFSDCPEAERFRKK